MTMSLKNSLAIVLLCLFAASAAFGQSVAPELNITLGEQRVRFAPTRSFQEMRLEVVNSVGEVVFTHTTTEAEFDWNLRAANSESLAPGLYRYALTLKFGEDQTRQHAGHFIVEKGQDQIWLTASDGTEVSGTALNAARSGGRSIAGLAGTEDKSVKRDVSGREIVDEKGNKLTDSAKAVKQEKAALLGTQNIVAKFGPGGAADTDSIIFDNGTNVGIGTTSPNAKLSVNANPGLPPSEVGIIGYFANANESNTFLTADSYGNANVHSDFLFRRARGTMAVPLPVQADDIVGQIQMRGYAPGGFVPTARAGIRLTAAENWTTTAQGAFLAFMTNPIGSANINVERMRLTDAGNLGIGNPLPGARLDVLGDIRSSALRQELTASPNIINGFMGTGSGGATPGNRVTPGVAGASIGGGGFNGTLGSITGDNSNRVTDWFGTIGGGLGNRAGNDDGGLDNTSFATVGGGHSNTASGGYAMVGGGMSNTASVFYATVGGGKSNTASGLYATVGGGDRNTASAPYATVSGGSLNTASINFSTVGGGANNTASSYYATVPGGESNTASGQNSFAAGYRAKANHLGAFVWADSTNADFASTANGQFLIRAAGGVGIGVNNPSSPLTVAGDVKAISGVIRATDSVVTTSMFSAAGFLAGFVGTESNHNFVLRTNGLDRMIFDTAGNVGIGTPGLPTRGRLEVVGLGSNTTVGGYFMNSVGVAPFPSASLPFSVFADNGIAGSVFIAFSDARIKRIHGQSDAARDLAMLAGIKVTDYSYIDTVSKGTGRQKKVIAQQVEEVFPQAVTRSTDVVPDIYQKAAAKDGWVTLATNLKQGERVRLISADKEGVYEVLEAEPTRFRTAFVAKGDEVFVYGREVKDFRSVDYEAISMLNVSATQELHRLMGQKDAEIKALAARLTTLEAVKAENEALAERLTGLEQMLQQLTQQTPKSQTKQQ